MKLISQHHLFVLPTTGENFGHAIFESLLAGRPVLISDQTPWLQLQQQQAGWDLSLEYATGFTKVIKEVAGFDQATFDEYATGHGSLPIDLFKIRFLHKVILSYFHE